MKFSEMTDLVDWREYCVESNWTNRKYTLSPSDFGTKEFKGRYHPDIPWIMMQRYTKAGETIWDPFAGGGTTADVGKLLKRKVISSDIAPVRSDIIEANAMDWYPEDSVQMVMLHPPYWDMIKYEGGSKSDQLSEAVDVSDFVYRFGMVLHQVILALDKSRMAILVISSPYKNSQEYPLDMLLYPEFRKRGFILKGRIVKDFGESKGGSQTRQRNLWHYRAAKGGFWRLNLDFIYVYQYRG